MPLPAPVVSASWLVGHLTDPDLILLDTTALLPTPKHDGDYQPASGYEAWRSKHIPGSRHADLLDALSDHAKPYHFAVPDPEDLARRVSALGVHDESTVVLYDNGGGIWAARLWWMLRGIGVHAAVLDGGLAAWQATGAPTVSGNSPAHLTKTSEPKRSVPTGTSRPGTLTATPRPDLWADINQVTAALNPTPRNAAEPSTPTVTVTVVCALSPDQFDGTAPTRYTRRGHIPGSINLPARGLTAPDGLLLKNSALHAALSPLIHAPGPIIVYCGGGISAALLALALAVAGRTDVALYDGSLEEWTKDPGRPVSVSF